MTKPRHPLSIKAFLYHGLQSVNNSELDIYGLKSVIQFEEILTVNRIER